MSSQTIGRPMEICSSKTDLVDARVTIAVLKRG